MAINQLPINNFRSIVKTLNSGSNLLYREDLDISTILLSAAVTNITSGVQTIIVSVQKSGSTDAYALLYNANIPPNEALNPFPGKVILERNDALIIDTYESGSLQVVLSVLENANN